MKTSEVFLAAAGLIADENNWTQGGYRLVREDGTVAYCMKGAMDHAVILAGIAGGNVDAFPLCRAVSRILSVQLDDCVEDWNDAAGREHCEVLDALYKAAATAKEAEVSDDR